MILESKKAFRSLCGLCGLCGGKKSRLQFNKLQPQSSQRSQR